MVTLTNLKSSFKIIIINVLRLLTLLACLGKQYFKYLLFHYPLVRYIQNIQILVKSFVFSHPLCFIYKNSELFYKNSGGSIDANQLYIYFFSQ